MSQSKLVLYFFLIIAIVLIRCGTSEDATKSIQNTLNVLQQKKAADSPPKETAPQSSDETSPASPQKQESEQATPGVKQDDAPPSTAPSTGL